MKRRSRLGATASRNHVRAVQARHAQVSHDNLDARGSDDQIASIESIVFDAAIDPAKRKPFTIFFEDANLVIYEEYRCLVVTCMRCSRHPTDPHLAIDPKRILGRFLRSTAW